MPVNTYSDASTALVKRPAHALAPRAHDPVLAAYLKEIGRHPVLPPDEQTRLAREYVRTGDAAIAARLVSTNLRLVVKMAHALRKSEVPLLDLIQEGNLGLMHALRKFDPEKGVRLTSYAAWWIRAYMLKAAMRDARLVRFGTSQTQRRLFFRLRKEAARLEAQGREVMPELLAETLRVPVGELVEMRDRLGRRDVSLDEPLHDDGAGTALDLLADEGAGADDQLVAGTRDVLVEEAIHAFGETLSGRDRLIFEERMVAEEPVTLRELGERLRISRERARQLEKALETKLARALRAQVPEALLAA